LTHVQLPQPKDQPIAIQVGAENPDGATLQASGGVILQPLALNLDAKAERLPLVPFAGAVRGATPVTLLGGTVGAAAKVDVKDRNGTYAIQASDIKLDLAGVSARDESLNPPITVGLKTLSLGVDRFVLGSGSSKFDLRAAGLLGEGNLASQGTVTLQPLAVKASVDLSNLNVAQLAPYAASRLNATVRSIRVGAKGDVDFAGAQGATPMKVSWKGGVDVNDLNLQDSVNRADFLAWKELSLRNMAISMAGGKPVIDLGDVLLDNFYGNVLLNSQGQLNVLDLVAEPGKAGGSITQDTPAPAGSSKASEPKAPPSRSRESSSKASASSSKGNAEMPNIAVHSVTLKNGRATFNDRFVKPNYTAELSAIEGSVSAVSSTDPKPANVSVKGRVYRTAPLTISGVVQPFAKFLTLDIKASARGVDLPRFTTYSAKYVGYPIERGKLSMDIEYSIKNRQLQASNRVQLDQLTFGPKTDSPQATTLPVMLAVALLKDSSGNIDINLPISGSLDDPNFSVGGIIVRVIGNLIVKAVTAPFSLLASAFGGGGDELSYIAFEPGSTTLTDDSKEKLKKLATALANRPSMKMDIAGRADPASDEAGLRQAWVDTRIRIARSRATGKSGRLDGDAPLSGAERAKYLAAAYDDTKIDNKPRNFIGMAKSVPPEQMESLLKQAAPAGQEQLRKLADARAQAVYEQLQQDGAPTDRIFMVAPKLSADGIKDDGPPTRVEFALKR
jgi:flagellar motor protein MotB